MNDNYHKVESEVKYKDLKIAGASAYRHYEGNENPDNLRHIQLWLHEDEVVDGRITDGGYAIYEMSTEEELDFAINNAQYELIKEDGEDMYACTVGVNEDYVRNLGHRMMNFRGRIVMPEKAA